MQFFKDDHRNSNLGEERSLILSKHHNGSAALLQSHLTASDSRFRNPDFPKFPVLLPTIRNVESCVDNEAMKVEEAAEEVFRQSLLEENHVDLARSVECGNNVLKQTNISFVLSLTTLSDDDEDVDVMKRVSTRKVLEWDDGGRQLNDDSQVENPLVAQRNGRPTHKKRGQVFKFVRPKAATDADVRMMCKDDPLKVMIPIQNKREKEVVPSSSLLALTGKGQNQKGKRGGKQKERLEMNKEVVMRTWNAASNQVTVSSLPQKRQGNNRQYSYYDITGELHNLR